MKNNFEGVKNVYLIIDHDQYPVLYQIKYSMSNYGIITIKQE